MVKNSLFSTGDFYPWIYALGGIFIPLFVVSFGLSLFYWLAPRRTIRFSNVWAVALGAAVLLQAAESLFSIYLKRVAALNVAYGVFGGVMGLLLWIYLSGGIFIFGACLCAARAGGCSPAEKTISERRKKEIEP